MRKITLYKYKLIGVNCILIIKNRINKRQITQLNAKRRFSTK